MIIPALVYLGRFALGVHRMASKFQNQTCCFTGHRQIPPYEMRNALRKAESTIRDLYGSGYRYFGVGGALGFDTEIAKLLFRLRTNGLNELKVILVYPFSGYNSRWTPAQQDEFRSLLPQYDKTVCVSDVPGRDAYLARNRHLVNGSSVCIAYCTDPASGTGYTVRYAAEQGLRVINLAEL